MTKTTSDMLKTLHTLMQKNAGVGGADFRSQVRRAPRVFPKKLRRDAEMILQADKLGGNPKLERQINQVRLGQAYDRLHDFLKGMDPKDRRRGMILGWMGGMAVNVILLIIAAIVFFMVRSP